MGTLRRCRVIIVGCGSSGICMMHRLKTFMTYVEWVCYEKNEECVRINLSDVSRVLIHRSVSGTWFENRSVEAFLPKIIR